MHEDPNLFLFLIEINNMHHTRHILPIPRICIWHRCGRCCWCGICNIVLFKLLHDHEMCHHFDVAYTAVASTCSCSLELDWLH